MNSRQYDLIILGASGFTGRLVVEYLVANYGTDGDLKWAIAGRNQEKLEEIRALYMADSEQSALPIVVADNNDPQSLQALVAQTRVLCTTVGPYAIYGAV